MTTHATTITTSYTTPGRHRREVGTGRIRIALDHAWAGTAGLEVTVNGYVVALTHPETVIRVPAGPMLVELRGARAEFVLGEDEIAEISATAPRLGRSLSRSAGHLHVAGQAV